MAAPTVLVLAGVLAHPATAAACSDTTIRGDVIGVSSDGRFVSWRQIESGRDCTTHEVAIVDRAGKTVGSFSRCEKKGWQVAGRATSLRALTRGAKTAQALAKRLKKRLGLTPLKKSSAHRVLQVTVAAKPKAPDETPICARFSFKQNVVAAPVAEIPFMAFGCVAPKASLHEHAKTPVRFVRHRYVSASAGCSTKVSDTLWVARNRVDAAFGLAQPKGKASDMAYAKRLLTVVRKDPGNVPARIALIGAVEAAGLDWAKAKALVDVSWPAKGCFGADVNQVGEALMGNDKWLDATGFEKWLDGQADPSNACLDQTTGRDWR
jgi:hypothetical protein